MVQELYDITKPPVIRSQSSAELEFKNGIERNDLRQLTDQDQQTWQVHIEMLQTFSPETLKKEFWEIKIHTDCEIGLKDFLSTKVLNPQHDQRLLELLGDHKIYIKMNPLILHAHTYDEARSLLANTFLNLKEKFSQSNLKDMKKKYIEQYIEKSCQFGFSG